MTLLFLALMMVDFFCNLYLFFLSDADRYMKSFGLSVSILTIIVVSAAVKYGMQKYEERIENARLEKKRDKETRKQKKSGRKP